MEIKQVTFRVDAQLVKRMKFVALEEDRSLTDLLIEAIEAMLKKYERQEKKSKK